MHCVKSFRPIFLKYYQQQIGYYTILPSHSMYSGQLRWSMGQLMTVCDKTFCV